METKAALQAEYDAIVAQIDASGLQAPGSKLAIRTEELIAKAEALVAAGAKDSGRLRILLAKASDPGWIERMAREHPEWDFDETQAFAHQ